MMEILKGVNYRIESANPNTHSVKHNIDKEAIKNFLEEHDSGVINLKNKPVLIKGSLEQIDEGVYRVNGVLSLDKASEQSSPKHVVVADNDLIFERDGKYYLVPSSAQPSSEEEAKKQTISGSSIRRYSFKEFKTSSPFQTSIEVLNSDKLFIEGIKIEETLDGGYLVHEGLVKLRDGLTIKGHRIRVKPKEKGGYQISVTTDSISEMSEKYS